MKRKRGGLEIKRRKNGKTLELRWGRTERELEKGGWCGVEKLMVRESGIVVVYN